MTVIYQLTKNYHRRKPIVVDSGSLKDLLAGKRTTLDHLVEFEHIKYIVTRKPLVDDYSLYITRYLSYETYERRYVK